jgi:hypothetical protein
VVGLIPIFLSTHKKKLKISFPIIKMRIDLVGTCHEGFLKNQIPTQHCYKLYSSHGKFLDQEQKLSCIPQYVEIFVDA